MSRFPAVTDEHRLSGLKQHSDSLLVWGSEVQHDPHGAAAWGGQGCFLPDAPGENLFSRLFQLPVALQPSSVFAV